MILWKDKKTDTIKKAYKIEERGDKVIIQYDCHGKKYTYSKKNIELLKNVDSFLIYILNRTCYRCQKEISV